MLNRLSAFMFMHDFVLENGGLAQAPARVEGGRAVLAERHAPDSLARVGDELKVTGQKSCRASSRKLTYRSAWGGGAGRGAFLRAPAKNPASATEIPDPTRTSAYWSAAAGGVGLAMRGP